MRSLHRLLTFSFLLAAPLLCVSLMPRAAAAQELEPHKAGVVRIRNNKLHGTGTGFVLKVENDRAYIITAAHVVSGDASPSVYFFNRPNDAVPATLIDAETADAKDAKGLALLEVKPADSGKLKGLTPLKLSNYLARGGEPVSIIGFTGGVATPGVSRANVSRLDGRHLVFDRSVAGGNSGGPVLYEGRVIGLVTDTEGESAYAVRAENIPIYVSGINRQLADSLRAAANEQVVITGSPESAKFCRALGQIIAASRNDFSAIMKTESPANVADMFDSTVTLPGTFTSTIFAESKTWRASSNGADKTGSGYYKFISMIKLCLPDWKQTELSKERADGGVITATGSLDLKSYLFTESDKGVVVEVSQFKRISTGNSYYASIIIYAPDSPRKRRLFSSSREGSALSILNYIGDEEGADKVCQAVLRLVDASRGNFYSIVKPTGVSGVFNSTVEVPEFPEPMVSPGRTATFVIGAGDASEKEGLYYRLAATLGRCLKGWKGKENADNSNTPRAGERYYRFFEDQNGPVVEISYPPPTSGNNRILFLVIYPPNSPARPGLTN